MSPNVRSYLRNGYLRDMEYRGRRPPLWHADDHQRKLRAFQLAGGSGPKTSLVGETKRKALEPAVSPSAELQTLRAYLATTRATL